ncbi:hypothetical protein PYH37_001956 [Sinorhizobium numidicum]|uniref:Uncharacterized protein n=1 Tax=Sinorhizobium numidicum TaxID=680248 RepID=A0ABY8CPD8_9HYPH|nr:hypothetical protein [Sinorhizobium numidicum]WEX74521.1 hypothetical protein PYH37_001956 [Sinorhizobium numidicum]WEX80511.1 hypothetical protein PYH38_001958 [Sinorhizobium numidicum]
MKVLNYRKRAGTLGMAAVAVLIAIVPGSEGFACGYDNPRSISRGSLNWSYPFSLHVMGAISREVAARRLPIANFDRGGMDLFGRKYLRAKKALEQFGEMLRPTSREPLPTPVAVVLVEPMLWARFEMTAVGLRTAVHVPGAERGDLVIITGEAVIAEIAARRLMFGDAYARGIVRLYGEDRQIAAFVQKYQQVGANRSTRDTRQRSTPAPHSVAADPSMRSSRAFEPNQAASSSETLEKLVQ